MIFVKLERVVKWQFNCEISFKWSKGRTNLTCKCFKRKLSSLINLNISKGWKITIPWKHVDCRHFSKAWYQQGGLHYHLRTHRSHHYMGQSHHCSDWWGHMVSSNQLVRMVGTHSRCKRRTLRLGHWWSWWHFWCRPFLGQPRGVAPIWSFPYTPW